jgi:hypothetical protein
MKQFSLLVLTLVVSIASAYNFTFTLDLEGPSDDCGMPDLNRTLRTLETVIEARGNAFLRQNHLDGEFIGIHIDAGNTRNLEEMDADEVMNLSDMELEELGHRQLWGFLLPFGEGQCRSCPIDDGDGRRNLRALEGDDMPFSKQAISEWVNKKLAAGGLASDIRNNGQSDSCKNSADRWTGTFVWN